MFTSNDVLSENQEGQRTHFNPYFFKTYSYSYFNQVAVMGGWLAVYKFYKIDNS